MSMESTTTRKQFDLGHIRVDEKLQGAPLASFTRRMMAYLIDWLIIIACSEFLWLLIPLFLVFLIVKKRLKRTMVVGRRIIKKNVLYADHQLEALEIDQKLRKRFARNMVLYMYILMYAPIVIAALLLLGVVFNLVFPENYDTVATHTSSVFGTMFKPINSLNDGLGLLAKFFGAFAYFSVFTWKWKGQTPGKKLMQIKVVKLNGTPITFWGSLERASGYTASTALLFYGFLQYFWERNGQTTHDKITETIVIESKPFK